MKNTFQKTIAVRLASAVLALSFLPIAPAQASWRDDFGAWLKNALAPTVWADKAGKAAAELLNLATVQNVALAPNNQPLIGVIRVYETIVTGYSSSFDETDSTPFITASGEKVRDGIVAANFLPFGARVRIPDIFGDKIFVVKDRMARKHDDKVDIWFETKTLAKAFGKKKLLVEV